MLTLNKAALFKIVKVENDLDIIYAVGNANNQRQENIIETTLKKTKFCIMGIDLKKYGKSRY